MKLSYAYCITNLINGMRYVGVTDDFDKRINSHKNAGKKGYHNRSRFEKGKVECRGLYLDMKENGLENFKFELIETFPYEDRRVKEKYWIEKLDTYINGYNETPYGGANMDEQNGKYDESSDINSMPVILFKDEKFFGKYPSIKEASKDFFEKKGFPIKSTCQSLKRLTNGWKPKKRDSKWNGYSAVFKKTF